MASVAGQIAKYKFGFDVRTITEMFNINIERNLPTFFSMLLLLWASVLLVLIATVVKKAQAPDFSKWVVLAMGFFFMAYDEGFQVHERFIEPMRNLMGDGDLGAFYYAWVIPALFLVAGFGVFFLKFLFRLPIQTRKMFVLAAALFVGGAIGMELVGGGFDEAHGYDNLSYNLISTVEESMEMVGLIVFIRALFEHLGLMTGSVLFRFNGK
ncbi:MAG: hypothetical protein GY780_09660 [bacterium]|nr:hypothetical protein [bacterium]